MVLARETVQFKACDGTILRGWFYPQINTSACVIMTHGVRTPSTIRGTQVPTNVANRIHLPNPAGGSPPLLAPGFC